MSNPKRKKKGLVEDIDLDRISFVPIDKAIEYLCELRDNTNLTAQLDIEVQEDYYDSYSVVGKLYWNRMETDEEYEKRCKEHHNRSAAARKVKAAQKIQKEKDERAKLAELKAKYENE